MGDIVISADFLDNHIFTSNHAYAMVYLCALRYKSQNTPVPASKEIAKKLGMKTSDVDDAIAFWKSEGFNIFSNNKPESADKSQYTPCEISSFIESDKELEFLYSEAQKAMGKTLSTAAIQTLFWIYDYLGFSTPLIILLINYAVKENKAKMNYIEKAAVDWAERGITTIPLAEQYLTDLERSKTYAYKISKILYINRPLLPSEKQILEQWENILKPTEELINCAYEVCIERKNKMSLKYINGILKSWVEKGYKNKADVASERKTGVKTTSFSNFTPRSKIDYKKLEREALQKRIDEAKQVN